jgi:xanthine dehydrogenase YagR molybdenum-binding subunit
MRIAIYGRVSTSHQVDHQTIEQQLGRLAAHVHAHAAEGWSLDPAHVFRDDGYSGATLARPGLDRLRDAGKDREIDRVLITRLARNDVDQMVLLEEWAQAGCAAAFLDRPMSDDPHDYLLLQIRGAVAEYERTLIAKRMRRGRLAKLRAGLLLPWTYAPYGYRMSPDRPRDPRGVTTDPADAAFAAAPVKVEAIYTQPREHHNAIEPHATIAVWDSDFLTLYDKTQWVDNDRKEIAHVFGIPEESIRVVSPFVGGAFGSGLRTWPHVTVAVLAAKVVGRPVRVELTRRELYTSVGFRPHTEQRVALGAEQDGTLTAIIQEAWGQVSEYEEYAEVTLDPARNTYACPNVRTRYRLVEMNTNSPCPMRGPGVATGLLAHETAMDELAVALGMDPIALRLKNYAEKDQHKDLPWSSKELRECYRVGAERFGWAQRNPEPRSMREDGQLVGYGMATAAYPSHRSKASAKVTLFSDGTALVRSAASDMGPGTYTSITQVAADALGLPMEAVRFELGDTDMPFAPVHGGSITLASVGTAVEAACQTLLDDLSSVVRADQSGPFASLSAEDLEWRDGGAARRGGGEQVPFAMLLRGLHLDEVIGNGQSAPGDESKNYSSSAFGAVFVEVRVDPDLGTVRVHRIIGAYDIGRVVNPKTAHSQCIGGMVGALGMALLEQADWDERFGRVMNSNLAEYLVPVCADVRELDAIFVESEDKLFNPLGVKGVAELGICGVAPAIGNAVYHATGRRIRDFPILPEKLL